MNTPNVDHDTNVLKRGVRFLYDFFLRPRSTKESDRRHEFILNIILFSLVSVLIIFELFIVRSTIIQGDAYRGIPWQVFSVLIAFFSSLLILSRKGHSIPASYILISLFYVTITYTAYTWGMELPMTVLSYVLIIVTSGILLGSRSGFYLTFIIGITVTSLAYLEANLIHVPKSYWKLERPRFNDGVENAAIYTIIMVVSWLSNREIEKSLRRAQKSEKALQQERDQLEMKIEERTKELKQTQMAKVAELYRFAEFGRLSSGLFHDLVDPLNAVTLTIEQLQKSSGELPAVKEQLSQAVTASKRMDQFFKVLRKQLQTQDIQSLFLANEEIEQAVELLAYKARREHIRIIFEATEPIMLFGNPLKLHQVAQNLISNAIDAYYDQSPRANRDVLVQLSKKADTMELVVHDNGVGIPEGIQDRIFDAFFTTKTVSKGTGLGLSTTKSIVEKDFTGTILLESAEGMGTTFTVSIPLRTSSPA